jgi:hypothetical protein
LHTEEKEGASPLVHAACRLGLCASTPADPVLLCVSLCPSTSAS